MNEKYVEVSIGGIITSIALRTDTEGYTKGVIEAFMPGDEELDKWSAKETQAWITQNNKRMKAILKLLNENNL